MPQRNPETKIGLALAGGVIEGAFYELGALRAIEEAVDGLDLTRLDAYVGVSAGAVLTSLLANGVSPQEMSRAILSRATDPVLNIDPAILFSPAVGEYARRARKVPGTLTRWVKQRLGRPFDTSLVGSLLELGRLLPVGIFDSRPMERYLARVFASGGRSNDFRTLRSRLRVVAVKLDTAELVAFGDEATGHVPVSRAVQASLSLPGLYCPVEIDGETYIDGVAKRTLNASLALDEGIDLLFCINPIVPVDMRHGEEPTGAVAEVALGTDGHAPRPESNGNGKPMGKRRSLTEFGLPGVLSQTFRTMIHSRMGTGMRNYAHTYPDADVIVIEPEFEDHRMFFSNIFSFSNRREVCEHAYASTRRHLLARADELEEKLARRGLRLRRDVLAQERTLFAALDAEEAASGNVVVEEIKDTLDRLNRVLDRLIAA